MYLELFCFCFFKIRFCFVVVLIFNFYDRIVFFVCYDCFFVVFGYIICVDDVIVFENIGFVVDVFINNDSFVFFIGFCVLYFYGVYIIF